MNRFWKWATVALILTAGMFSFAADEKPANSILVYAYEFDRGNLAVQDVGVGYADKEPVVINGGTQPNSAEYDIEFPVTATYAVFAKYTAEQSRPVDICRSAQVSDRAETSDRRSQLLETYGQCLCEG